MNSELLDQELKEALTTLCTYALQHVNDRDVVEKVQQDVYTLNLEEDESTVPSYLHELVDQVPGWNISQAEVTRLTGGLSNDNFLVKISNQTSTESFVLRFLKPQQEEELAQDFNESTNPSSTETLTNEQTTSDISSLQTSTGDSKQECRVQVLASRLGIGPQVVHFDEKKRVYVSEYVSGDVLSEILPVDKFKLAMEKERMKRIIFSMRKFHVEGTEELKEKEKMDVNYVRTYDPFHDIHVYYQRALDVNVELPSDVHDALVAVDTIKEVTSPFHVLRLCHNDLHPGNFIDDGHKVHLIDFEYAGVGNLYFELANFAWKFRLETDDELLSFLALYFGYEKPSEVPEVDLHHVKLMMTLKLLDSGLWGFWQSKASTLDNGYDYRLHGQKGYDAFLQAIESPEYQASILYMKSHQPAKWKSILSSKWNSLIDWLFRPEQTQPLSSSTDADIPLPTTTASKSLSRSTCPYTSQYCPFVPTNYLSLK